jgi:hypothetical protein
MLVYQRVSERDGDSQIFTWKPYSKIQRWKSAHMIRICKSLTRAALPEILIQTSTCSANAKNQEETGEELTCNNRISTKKNGGWNFLNGDALVAVEFSNL